MKKVLMYTVLFLLCFGAFSSSAQNELPPSHINVGLGAGMNYGVFGVKTVIGYRNSGLLIGLGAVPGGLFGYEIGAQLGIESFYMNVGYGISGTYQVNDGPVQPIKCMSFIVGGMINLDKKKNWFVDLGVGHTFASETVQIGPFEENHDMFTAVIGVGVRLAKKKE
jgi:hypothetical protein